MNKIAFLTLGLLCLLSSETAMAQNPSKAYKDYKNDFQFYIQNELYEKVGEVLFDVVNAPGVPYFINFAKDVQKELESYLTKHQEGFTETENITAIAYSNTMMIQLGELYLERIQEKTSEEKLEFLGTFMEETGIQQSSEYISDELSRSMLMSLHSALNVPFGMPNTEVSEYISTMKEPKKELFSAANMINDIAMLTKNYEEISDELQEFKKDYPSSTHQANLEQSLASLEKLKQGTVVTNFKFVNLDGDSVSLADYKDKIIYLDLWASWCGPCINTFRTKTPDFEQKLKENEDVVLMYVSIDEKPDPWKNYLSKNQMGGVHLYAGKGFEAEIMKYFKVWGIPRYLIIGKDNKIINLNAPRPGNEAYDLLSALEKEQ